jgi:DNA polymerase-1
MIAIGRRLRGDDGPALRSRMILQVHDELLFEAPEDEVEELSAAVRERMEGAIRLEVPVVVDVGVGRSWYEAKG